MRSPRTVLLPAFGVSSLVLGVLTALPTTSAAGAAEAATAPDTVVVGSGDVSAAVRTSPFGLSFRDRRGREVLSSVPGGGVPSPAAHVADLLGTLADTDAVPPRYAPITFTVGTVSVTQFERVPAVTGNPLLELSSGVTYSLTRVLATTRLEDGGVRLTVATDDPSGRTAIVDVRPDRGDAVRTAVAFQPATGVAFVGAGFRSGPDEAFHGFGGRRNAIDQAGQSFFNFIDQTPLQGPGTGGQPQTGWYQQAQFISSRPYGFFLDQSELSLWRMRSDRNDAWQVESNSPEIRFTVAPGRAARAIRTLTAITGREPVPPRWQTAPIFSQTLTGAQQGKTAATYEAEIRASVRKIRQLHLPYKSFAFEGWWLLEQNGSFDDIVRLIRRNGMHPLVYFRAFAGNEGYGYEDPAAYDTAIRRGYVATRADGSPYVFGNTFDPTKSAVQLDFTNPRTVAWWRQRLVAALDAGADGFMQDFGEQTMWTMHFADGTTGNVMHNRYPVDFHRVTRQIIDRWHRDHPGRTLPMFYVRSGYSGRPGSAAYESANWCGDYESSWSRSTGLAALTTDMLNRAVGGAYGFQCDTGGIMDLRSGPVTRELFLRWSWFAALTPGNRLHGGAVFGQKFPWSFDDRAARIYRNTLRLHRAAEPYIMRLWRTAKRTGMPITRPLWLTYPRMAGVDHIDQEYLLGPNVLVAPVVTRGATRRAVQFPPGCWRDPVTGARFEGASTHQVPAPIDRHVYFFRCGTTPFVVPRA
jgi:alpha-D-xyloside xylohydrolase